MLLHYTYVLLGLLAATATAATPATTRPHILFVLVDDWGFSETGLHRNTTIGDTHVPATREVRTPNIDALARSGMILDRAYVYKCCSPTRSAVQSGRHPYHVNALNAAQEISNPLDPIGGFAGIPTEMTGVAEKMGFNGYQTHGFGKWDAGMATKKHTPRSRGYDTFLGYWHHDNDCEWKAEHTRQL